jgi:hypothetical protein
MFCPNCRTEYRPGFAKCADCGVDLVEHLSSENLVESGKPATDSEGRVLLWSGFDASRLQQALCSALDAGQIQYRQTEKAFGLLPTTVQSVTFLWVDPRDRFAARALVDRVLSDPNFGDEAKRATSLNDDAPVDPLGLNHNGLPYAQDEEESAPDMELRESDDGSEPAADDLAEDPDPEDATVEVWCGDDGEKADYLALCLRGVGVGCVVIDQEGKSRVMVAPVAEKRAQVIVREVVEGSPPR